MDSLRVLTSFADKCLKHCKVYDKYQFERIGFFSIDPDTSKNKVSHISINILGKNIWLHTFSRLSSIKLLVLKKMQENSGEYLLFQMFF